MVLSELFNGVLWLDDKVNLLYSKYAQKLTEEELYNLSSKAGKVGVIGPATLSQYVSDSLPFIFSSSIVLSWIFYGPDWELNKLGLKGELSKSAESWTKALDRRLEYLHNYNRSIRLQTLLIGAGFTAKGIYEFAHSIVTGQNAGPYDSLFPLITGTSFLSLATSMYIKDDYRGPLAKQSVHLDGRILAEINNKKP